MMNTANTTNTEKTKTETILVVSVENTVRNSQKNGKTFKAKILKTDKLGICSITEWDKGFESVEEGGIYAVTFVKNGNFTNIKSAKPVGPCTPDKDDSSDPPDFDISIPEFDQPAKPQTENTKDVSMCAVIESIEKMQKTLDSLGEQFEKLSEEFKALKAELENRG